VVADSHYGTAENYRQGQVQDQQTHLKSYQAASTGLYPASRFIYEAQADRFRQRLGYWEARVTELDIRRP